MANSNSRFKVDHGLVSTGNAEFYQRVDVYANAYFNNDLVLVTGNLVVQGNLNYSNVTIQGGGLIPDTDQQPLGNTSNRFNAYFYDVTVYSSLIPSSNGVTLGSSTKRYEIYGNTLTISSITLPGGGVVNSQYYSGQSETSITANNSNNVYGLSGTGYVVRTGTGTGATRTIVANNSNTITITNGDGTAGNTSIGIPIQAGLFANTTGIYVNASAVTVGTLPVLQGGTGASIANNAINNLLPTQTGYTGRVLATDGANVYWSATPGYTGSVGYTGSIGSVGYTGSIGSVGYTGSQGPIAGSNTQIVFNDSGTANGSANLTFDKTNNIFAVGQAGVINNGLVQIGGHSSIQSLLEKATVSATAATGTINFDVLTQAVLYYTTNSTANFTINIRGNSSTTANAIMQNGQSLTIAFLNTNGTTGYYANNIQVDGANVTPKWFSGTTPSSGSASSVDIYSLSILKTANGTYTIFATQSQFK